MSAIHVEICAGDLAFWKGVARLQWRGAGILWMKHAFCLQLRLAHQPAVGGHFGGLEAMLCSGWVEVVPRLRWAHA